MRISILLACLLCAQPVAAFAVEQGQPAPLFKGEPLQGNGTVDLAGYRGKVVYLDFWASWCAPCRQSLPLLDGLRREFQSAGFEVLAVNVDENPQDALDFLKKYPVSYPAVKDPQGTIARLYDVPGMPSSYLIGRDGKIRAVKRGFKKNEMPALKEAVAALVKEE